MRVTVLGPSGTLGTLVVAALEGRGHEVVRASRASGVDAASGAGVREAVTGADAVVDCTNVQAATGAKAVAGFGAIAHHVSDAVLREYVPHLVVPTIFGVHGERMQRRNGYYRGKAHQERVLIASGAPTTLVRTTQWFEIAETFLLGRVGPVALVPRMRSQPVAAREVADAIAGVVEAGYSRGPEVRIAGPEERDVADLAKAIAKRRGDPKAVLAFRIPGAGRLFDAGELLPGPDVPRVGPRFEEWLAARPR